jgi:hypothetical protein
MLKSTSRHAKMGYGLPAVSSGHKRITGSPLRWGSCQRAKGHQYLKTEEDIHAKKSENYGQLRREKYDGIGKG